MTNTETDLIGYKRDYSVFIYYVSKAWYDTYEPEENSWLSSEYIIGTQDLEGETFVVFEQEISGLFAWQINSMSWMEIWRDWICTPIGVDFMRGLNLDQLEKDPDRS